MSATDARVTVRVGGRLVCSQCLLADRPLARLKGLLGRRELPEDEGILIRPAASVHTAFMRFAIDVVFVDRDHRVVKIAASVPPWRIAAARGARHALELAAGRATRVGIGVGDVLSLSPRPVGGAA
jgi:uncharacterized membrane protein (UPF0127 family)